MDRRKDDEPQTAQPRRGAALLDARREGVPAQRDGRKESPPGLVPRDARREALQKTLRELAPDALSKEARRRAARDRERRRWLSKELAAQQLEFIDGIAATAALLLQARDGAGDPIYPSDGRYGLLAALERIGGWPSISELARVLRVSKQAAREQVVAAARAGLLELLPDSHDRRAIQIGLTPGGKRMLAAVRGWQLNLVTTLLLGLQAREMRLAAHVLRVIRERLLASRENRG